LFISDTNWSIQNRSIENCLFRQDQRLSTSGAGVESEFSTFCHSRSKFSRLSIFSNNRVSIFQQVRIRSSYFR